MAFQILVVDNQRETSKTVRAGLLSLGSDFSVATAMSGEEALLEARLRKFDLLISEVRLTGMSGIELTQKLRSTRPDLKAILISSSIDRYIRREATDIGIEILLQKPVEMTELLNEVKSILGLSGSSVSPQPQVSPDEIPPMGISDRLMILRQDLEASFALILSDTGEILMQAGNLQNLEIEAEISSLLAIFSAGNKISRLLGMILPDNLYAFRGNKHELMMAHIGESHALLIGILADKVPVSQMERINQIIGQGTQDLQAILMDMGVMLVTQDIPTVIEPLVVSDEDQQEIEEEFEIDQELDALFAKEELPTTSLDVDSFWEFASVEDTGMMASSDALSYEQARQLGLAPEEEN